MARNDVFKSVTCKTTGITLKICYDTSAENPRGWSNLGTMICWHRRYNLGDDHIFSEPRDFLEELAFSLASNIEWSEIQEKTNDQLTDIIKRHAIILPLYLYDHGDITINTTGFSCPWDSGQVGWIYAPKQKFKDETSYKAKALFGTDPNAALEVGDYVTVEGVDDKPHFGKVAAIDNKNAIIDWSYLYTKERHNDPALKGVYPIEKVKLVTEYAKTMLKNEVEIYDMYLRGDVYGFLIEGPDNNVIDSCWGFYGSNPETNGMVDYIDKKYHYLFELLK